MTTQPTPDELSHCACGATWNPAVQAHRQCPLRKKVKQQKCDHAWVLSTFIPPTCLWCGMQKPRRTRA